MAQPTRSGRTPKRTYTDMAMEPESDGDYMPEPATSKSPKPQKTKVSKPSATTTTKKPRSKEDRLARVPDWYYTPNGCGFFTKEWGREVSQLDEFWEDLASWIPKGTWRKRTAVIINTEYNANTAKALADRNKKAASSSTGRKSKATTADTVTVDIPASQTTITCHVCQKKSDNRTDICNLCLAQDDDGFQDDVRIKSEGKAETKLRAKPYGTKTEPVKLEDEVKLEEDSEDRIDAPPAQTLAADGGPKLMTLGNGMQAIVINGEIQLVTSSQPLRLNEQK